MCILHGNREYKSSYTTRVEKGLLISSGWSHAIPTAMYISETISVKQPIFHRNKWTRLVWFLNGLYGLPYIPLPLASSFSALSCCNRGRESAPDSLQYWWSAGTSQPPNSRTTSTSPEAIAASCFPLTLFLFCRCFLISCPNTMFWTQSYCKKCLIYVRYK